MNVLLEHHERFPVLRFILLNSCISYRTSIKSWLLNTNAEIILVIHLNSLSAASQLQNRDIGRLCQFSVCVTG